MLLKQIFALSALFVSFAAASPMPHPLSMVLSRLKQFVLMLIHLDARAIAEDDFLIKKSEESAALEKRYQCKAKRQAIMEKRAKSFAKNTMMVRTAFPYCLPAS